MKKIVTLSLLVLGGVITNTHAQSVSTLKTAVKTQQKVSQVKSTVKSGEEKVSNTKAKIDTATSKIKSAKTTTNTSSSSVKSTDVKEAAKAKAKKAASSIL